MALIGIDLGTTNSLIAVWEESVDGAKAAPRLIANVTGSVLTPSAVSILDDGSIVVGQAAYERRLTHPSLTATEFKRDMGSTRSFQLAKHSFSPEQLSSLVLSSLKSDAEADLGVSIDSAVISVPAYFNDNQRKATLVAADLAELKVTRLINEPTAASLSYGVGQSSDDSNTTLVFDLGGGTFDVSLVDFFEGMVEIKASTGDNYLGGEDFTQAIAGLIAEKSGISPNAMQTPDTSARVRSAAERIKRKLSQQPSVTTQLKLDSGEFDITITEDELKKCCEELLERIRKPVARALRDARIDMSTLDSVVLVGGSTRMPIVRKLVSRLLGRFPDVAINPDEAIALGAATQAALVARNVSLEEVMLTDVCPYSLGVASYPSKTLGGGKVVGVMATIVERNTLLPASREEYFGTSVDRQTKVKCEVYQGEHRYVKDNILLGSLEVKVPAKKAGEATIVVRFTYDISGILDVDVEVPDTGEKYSKTLLGNAVSLSKSDVEKKRKQLKQLKVHPRETLANKALIERADRLYIELNGMEREQLGEALDGFVAVLETQDLRLIDQKRLEFKDWLDKVEALLT